MSCEYALCIRLVCMCGWQIIAWSDTLCKNACTYTLACLLLRVVYSILYICIYTQRLFVERSTAAQSNACKCIYIIVRFEGDLPMPKVASRRASQSHGVHKTATAAVVPPPNEPSLCTQTTTKQTERHARAMLSQQIYARNGRKTIKAGSIAENRRVYYPASYSYIRSWWSR